MTAVCGSLVSPVKTVVIFAHECAPYHRPQSTIGAQRPAQFAKWLPEFGWRVVVICCDRDRRRTLDARGISEVGNETTKRLLSERAKSSIILPTPSLLADGPVDRVWHSLASSPISGKQPALSLRKGLTALKLRTGDYSQSWQPCARLAATTLAGTMAVDVCVGEHGPDAGLFLGAWFSRRYGVPWIADFRDPVLQGRAPLMRTVYEPIVKRLVRSAYATVNVTPQWASQDAVLFGKEAVCVTNGYDPEEMLAAKPRSSNGQVTISYLGQVLTPDQSLEPFLSGMALVAASAPDDYQALRFVYAGVHADYVTETCRRYGVLESATIRGQIDRTDALALMMAADVLLIAGTGKATTNEWIREGFYPGKIFEYLGAGRPILCVPEDGWALKELLDRTRTGVSLNSPHEVCEYLRARVRDARAGVAVSFQPDGAEVSKYTRRNQTARLAVLLDQAVSQTARPPAASVETRRMKQEA